MGTDVQLILRATGGAKISKILTKFQTTEIVDGEAYRISVGDMTSESWVVLSVEAHEFRKLF